MQAPDPLLRAREIAEAFLEEPVLVRPLTGGLVHFVFLAVGHNTRDRIIVKLRDTQYARLPSLSCEPRAISREAAALRRLEGINALTGSFPSLLWADAEKGYIITTEVTQQGSSLADLFAGAKTFPKGIAYSVGSLLGLCHSVAADFLPDPADEPFFERELDYKILRYSVPLLERIAGIAREGPRLFVLGDRSPKNIIVGNSQQVFFVDLDSAHFGSQVLEAAYAAAHLLLHGAILGCRLPSLHSEFMRGYTARVSAPDELVYAAGAAAALLYRVKNPHIPYDCNLDLNNRVRVAEELSSVLSKRQELTLGDVLLSLEKSGLASDPGSDEG